MHANVQGSVQAVEEEAEHKSVTALSSGKAAFSHVLMHTVWQVIGSLGCATAPCVGEQAVLLWLRHPHLRQALGDMPLVRRETSALLNFSFAMQVVG